MSCLDHIVTTGICPDDGQSLSGYRLVDAPGISIKGLSKIANETYVQGIDLALSKKSQAIIGVRNDLLAALQLNGVANGVYSPVFDSASFHPEKEIPASVLERGVMLHRVNFMQGGLKATKIKSVNVYPLDSGSGEIVIIDKGKRLAWPVNFVAGQINVFDSDSLDGFDYSLQSKDAKVLISAPGIRFASSEITCLQGCHGTNPNDCGWVDGWDGNRSVKSEGFGINIRFYCECDYERILCDLAKSFTGELIFLKWQILIFEEQLMTNRFNNWVIYNQEKLSEYVIPELKNQYNGRWNALMSGMMNILRTYRDDCIKCSGIRWVVNA